MSSDTSTSSITPTEVLSKHSNSTSEGDISSSITNTKKSTITGSKRKFDELDDLIEFPDSSNNDKNDNEEEEKKLNTINDELEENPRKRQRLVRNANSHNGSSHNGSSHNGSSTRDNSNNKTSNRKERRKSKSPRKTKDKTKSKMKDENETKNRNKSKENEKEKEKEKEKDNSIKRKHIECPYLDQIDRKTLDFDFEKVCSVSMINHNVYGCLVCGQYFAGRAQGSHAYFHALQENHRIFIHLDNGKIYCLPDDYEVIDPSLEDIKVLFIYCPHPCTNET